MYYLRLILEVNVLSEINVNVLSIISRLNYLRLILEVNVLSEINSRG